jgi:BolA protein
MTSVAQRIRDKLDAAFEPEQLDVVDDSASHAGHAAARPGGESHFRVAITAAAFAGTTRVERQRLVYGILADELAGPVHALEVRARAPGDAG